MRLNRYMLAFAIAAVLLCSNVRGQNKPLFKGAELLDSCVVELPLTYARKDNERCTQAARALENEELIYLDYDKRSGTATYSRVYVVAETVKGQDFVYLERPDVHAQVDGPRQAFFPKFTAKSQRFYRARCFDAQVAHHPELKQVLKEETFGE